MKKRFLICIMLVVILCFHSGVVGDASTYQSNDAWENKIEPHLYEIMEDSVNKIPVWIWLQDIEHTEAEAKVFGKTGLNESNLGAITESMSENLINQIVTSSQTNNPIPQETKTEIETYLERTKAARAIEDRRVNTYLNELRSTKKEMLHKNTSSIIKRLGINDADIILSQTQAPVFIAQLRKNDVLRIAKSSLVTRIYYYDSIGLASDASVESDFEQTTLSKTLSETGLDGSGVKWGILESGKVSPCTELAATRINYLNGYDGSGFTNHAQNVAKVAVGSNGIASNATIYSGGLGEDIIGLEVYLLGAINELINRGVTVVNISWGHFVDLKDSVYKPYEIFLDYVIKNYRISIVVAAGNSTQHIYIDRPGMAYNVITVGGFSLQHNQLYEDSAYGNHTGCEKPELIAPMVGGIGTSFSAPVVSGTIALLQQLRPLLKVQPEAVKAILMASCHEKAPLSELIIEGITERQGAGIMDIYRAVAIAGSGHFGVRTMSASTTQETVRFSQPGYDSDGLNVSLSWLVNPPNNSTAGNEINLDLTVNKNSTVMGTSALNVSSAEMVYIRYPSNTLSNYTLQINRQSTTGESVRLGYAFSIENARYQHTDITEGVFYLQNKASGYYLTTNSSGQTYQSSFLGTSSQKWVLTNGTICPINGNNRLDVGDILGGDYDEVITTSSTGAAVIFQLNNYNGLHDGSYSFYNPTYDYGLGIYNNSTSIGSLAAWSPFESTNTYQQWYLVPIAYQRGDISANGIIDSADEQLIRDYIGRNITFSNLQLFLADMNGNGTVNSIDWQKMLQIIES